MWSINDLFIEPLTTWCIDVTICTTIRNIVSICMLYGYWAVQSVHISIKESCFEIGGSNIAKK